MTWLTWRQHRAALLAGLIVTVGLAGVAIALGIPMHRAFAAIDLAGLRAGTARATAQADLFFHDYWSLGNLPWRFLLFLPALVGMFVGAPLLGRELEAGTYRLAWTQSVSRTRWLAVRVGLLSLATVAASLVLGAVLYWFFEPWSALGGRAEAFASIGPAFAARMLFALLLGVALGALIRRVVPAMAATVGAWIVVEFVQTFWLRPHYLTPLTIRVPASRYIDTNYYVSQWWVDPAGHRLSGTRFDALSQRLAEKGVAAEHWLIGHHYVMWASVQPDSRFWAFQAIETGLLCAVSAVLVAATFWLIRKRLG
jgi:hypothetical protein